MTTKTVVAMIKYRETEIITRTFPECVEVGKDHHYKNPTEFINDLKRLYLKGGELPDGRRRFEITSVVIG